MKRHDQGPRLATCAIATCAPNELMAKIHDRMPVPIADIAVESANVDIPYFLKNPR